MLRPYDSLYDSTIKIGHVEPCEPEAFYYTVPGVRKTGRGDDGDREGDLETEVTDRPFRIVLVGKRGLRGYRSEPVFVVERRAGLDAFGVEAWVDAHENPSPLVVALFLALRSASGPGLLRRGRGAAETGVETGAEGSLTPKPRVPAR